MKELYLKTYQLFKEGYWRAEPNVAQRLDGLIEEILNHPDYRRPYEMDVLIKEVGTVIFAHVDGLLSTDFYRKMIRSCYISPMEVSKKGLSSIVN